MFGRIVNSNVLALSYRLTKFSATIPSRNLSRHVSDRKPAHRVANNALRSSCRLYSKEASPQKMVVDFNEVQKATTDGKVLIVDVREPEEIKEYGKIPNSVNIPLGTVSTVLSTMSEAEFERTYKRPKPTEDSEIIFYCMIGKRSGMAQQNAFDLGYKNVKNYLGSWTDWANKIQ